MSKKKAPTKKKISNNQKSSRKKSSMTKFFYLFMLLLLLSTSIIRISGINRRRTRIEKTATPTVSISRNETITPVLSNYNLVAVLKGEDLKIIKPII